MKNGVQLKIKEEIVSVLKQPLFLTHFSTPWRCWNDWETDSEEVERLPLR